MKKKFKLITTSAVALLQLTFVGQSYAFSSTFTDIDNVVAKDKIIDLEKNGIVGGVDSEHFVPYESLTGAQEVQLIIKALGLNLDSVRFIKAPKATDYFKNADDEAWYSNSLIIAAVNGLEFPSDFDPNKKITREEFTYNLIRAMEVKKEMPMINMMYIKVKDEDQLKAEYSGAIQRAIKYGVIKLDAEGKFNPKGEITRADAAEEIYNAIEFLEKYNGSHTR
ncbi:MAG TPA: S-layer homology domain-containing protein [Bacillota bacterium]|nr:S-layer homology domain-containing protein [Bacillota bacterium]